MPRPEIAHMPHRILWWEKTGVDRYGVTQVSAGEDIRGRWNANRSEALAPDGTRIAVDATVTLRQDVKIGDQMWLAPDMGYLASEQWYGSGSGGEDDEVMEVVTFSKIYDVKGRVAARVAGLKKYKDAPSEIV